MEDNLQGVSCQPAQTQSDVLAAMEFAAKVYGPNYFAAKRSHDRILKLELSSKPENFILARDKSGSIVGLARIVERELLLPLSSLSVGGISTVCSHPDWKGRGIGIVLMEKALSYIQDRKYDISLLFGRRAVDGYYSRFGYEGVSCHMSMRMEIVSSDYNLALPDGIQLSSPCSDDLPSIQTLYESASVSIPVRLGRTLVAWRLFLERLEDTPSSSELIVVRRGGTITGYVILNEEALAEAAFDENRYDLALAILRDTVAMGKNSGLLIIGLPMQHAMSKWLSARNHVVHLRRCEDGGHMVRVNNPIGCLHKMKNCMIKRIESAGLRPFSIRIGDINYFWNGVDLQIREADLGLGQNRCGQKETYDCEVDLAKNDWAKLLLGTHFPGEYGGYSVSGRAGIFYALFPMLWPQFSVVDEF